MKILAPQFRMAEFARTVFVVVPDPGTTVDDLRLPESWVHVANKLNPGDHIEVVPASREWFAELFVTAIDSRGAHVVVLREQSLLGPSPDVPEVKAKASTKKPKPATQDDEDAFTSDEYKVEFVGVDKWRVVRKSDREVVAKGMGRKDDAESWVREHETALV